MADDEHGRTQLLRAITNNELEAVSTYLDNDECAMGFTANCILINQDQNEDWNPVTDNYNSNGLHLVMIKTKNEEMAERIMTHLTTWHSQTAQNMMMTHLNNEDYSPLYLALKFRMYSIAEGLLNLVKFDETNVSVITKYSDPSEEIKGYNMIMMAAYDGRYDIAVKLMKMFSSYSTPQQMLKLFTDNISNRDDNLQSLNLQTPQDDRLDAPRPGMANTSEHYSLVKFLVRLVCQSQQYSTECEQIFEWYLDSIQNDIEDQLLNWSKISSSDETNPIKVFIERDFQTIVETKLLTNQMFTKLLSEKVQQEDCWYKDWLYHMTMSARMRHLIHPHFPKFFLVPKHSYLTALVFYAGKHLDKKYNINDAYQEAQDLSAALKTRGFQVRLFPQETTHLWNKRELLEWIKKELDYVKSTAGAVILCGMTHGSYGYMNDTHLNTIEIKANLIDILSTNVYAFVPKILIVEACQKYYGETVSVNPPSLDHDNMILFVSSRPSHLSYTNCAIAELCKHIRDREIPNFLDVFHNVMESMDMSSDPVVKSCKPKWESTMRRRQLYLPKKGVFTHISQ